MEYPITYLYTLSNENFIFYIGKTKAPKNRFATHCSKIKGEFIMEIVKEYIDEEDKLIMHFINENKNIGNLQLPKNVEGYFEIGTKFISKQVKLKNKPIFDRNLNKIWNSIKDCAAYYNVQYPTISNHLKGNNTKINNKLNLEYVN
jgi:hypothetical protein